MGFKSACQTFSFFRNFVKQNVEPRPSSPKFFDLITGFKGLIREIILFFTNLKLCPEAKFPSSLRPDFGNPFKGAIAKSKSTAYYSLFRLGPLVQVTPLILPLNFTNNLIFSFSFDETDTP